MRASVTVKVEVSRFETKVAVRKCSSKYVLLKKSSVKKSCFEKFCNIHRKTPALEFLFYKVAGLKIYNFIKKRP